MSIPDDDINSQPAEDGLPPIVFGEVDEAVDDSAGDSDATDGGD